LFVQLGCKCCSACWELRHQMSAAGLQTILSCITNQAFQHACELAGGKPWSNKCSAQSNQHVHRQNNTPNKCSALVKSACASSKQDSKQVLWASRISICIVNTKLQTSALRYPNQHMHRQNKTPSKCSALVESAYASSKQESKQVLCAIQISMHRQNKTSNKCSALVESACVSKENNSKQARTSAGVPPRSLEVAVSWCLTQSCLQPERICQRLL